MREHEVIDTLDYELRKRRRKRSVVSAADTRRRSPAGNRPTDLDKHPLLVYLKQFLVPDYNDIDNELNQAPLEMPPVDIEISAVIDRQMHSVDRQIQPIEREIFFVDRGMSFINRAMSQIVRKTPSVEMDTVQIDRENVNDEKVSDRVHNDTTKVISLH
jgi:hypothetical protein